MTLIDSSIAVIFGVVQGLTEFLPISSSGHLLLLHEVFPSFSQGNALGFDVALHVGTLIALLIFYRQDCWQMVQSVFFRRNSPEKQSYRRLAGFVLLATVPALVVGALFEDAISSFLRSPFVVVIMLIAVAAVFIVVEWFRKGKRSFALEQLSWIHAGIIGVFQTLAFIPGTSRSGITIVAGMLMSLSREAATRFSFLIALPILFIAGLKKIIDLVILDITRDDLFLLTVGIVSSAVTGYLAIMVLLKFVRTHTLIPFAIYRILLGGALLLFFTLR